MSVQEIQNRLVDYIKAFDPEADFTQGPIYDLMLRPIPEEIDLGATNAQRLLTLYSRALDSSQLSARELDALAKNLRVTKPEGTKATVTLKFVLTGVPTSVITIASGTAVGTSDLRYIFLTDYTVTINPDSAYAFYNSTTGRYEVFVTATAQNTGDGYNLPLNRINTLVNPIAGVVSAINTQEASGGSTAGGSAAYFNRVQTALNGRDLTNISAYRNAIANQTGYVDYLLFVSAADRTKFKRKMVGSAYDVYVGKSGYSTYVDTYTYTSGPQVFVLRSAPVYEIQYVMVNGTVLPLTDWAFARDTSAEYGGSTSAQDKVTISYALSANDVVSIYYTVNINCILIQQALKELDPQNTSFLVREMKDIPVRVTINLVVSQVSASLIDSATNIISNLCNSNDIDSLSIADIQIALTSALPTVRTASVTRLCRRSDPVESARTITLGYDERISLDTTSGDLVITAVT